VFGATRAQYRDACNLQVETGGLEILFRRFAN